MPRLELESPHGLIDLESILQTGSGVQALSGVTGLGLPPLQSQYVSGAADGSRHQHSRYTHRDIDIPIYVLGNDRAALKARVSELIRTIDKQDCILRWVDDHDVWYLDVRFVGGGQWAMGEDTTGTRDLLTVLTLRAGDPMWKRTTDQAYTLASPTGGTVVLDAQGDTATWPTVTLTGPGCNFQATSPTGDVLAWNGLLLDGETLTIDFENRTAIDGYGRNRYSEFDVAPEFWQLPAGESLCSFSWENDSEDFVALSSQDNWNFVTNPTFKNNLTGWTQRELKVSSTKALTGKVITREPTSYAPNGSLSIKHRGAGRNIEYYLTLTGLEVGRTYRAGTRVAWSWTKKAKKNRSPYVRIGGRRYHIKHPWVQNKLERIDFEFVATSTSQQIALGTGVASNNETLHTRFWNVYVTDGPAAAYFSGDMPDTPSWNYTWQNASQPHNSWSLRSSTAYFDLSASRIRVAFTPRRAAVL